LKQQKSKYEEAIINQTYNTGLFIKSTYNDVLNSVKSSCSQSAITFTAINNYKNFDQANKRKRTSKFKTIGAYKAGELVRTGGNKVEYMGAAVLDGDETRVMLMARDEFQRGFFSIPDPKEPKYVITLDVRKQRSPSIKVSFDKGKPIINLTVKLEGDILSSQSEQNYEDEKLKPILENSFKKYLKKEVDRTIKKCQKLNADVFEFGDEGAKKFWTIPEWEKFNWNKKFKSAMVITEVTFKIRRFGTLMKTSPVKAVKEGQK
jgi:spore germination protein KC